MQIDADELAWLDAALRGPPAPGVHVLRGADVQLSHVFAAGLEPGERRDRGQLPLRHAGADRIAESAERADVLAAHRSVDLDFVGCLHRPGALDDGLGLDDVDAECDEVQQVFNAKRVDGERLALQVQIFQDPGEPDRGGASACLGDGRLAIRQPRSDGTVACATL